MNLNESSGRKVGVDTVLRARLLSLSPSSTQDGLNHDQKQHHNQGMNLLHLPQQMASTGNVFNFQGLNQDYKCADFN